MTWSSTRATPTVPSSSRASTFTGVAIKTYDVPSLAAGAYVFVCTIHPGMQGNMTAG